MLGFVSAVPETTLMDPEGWNPVGFISTAVVSRLVGARPDPVLVTPEGGDPVSLAFELVARLSSVDEAARNAFFGCSGSEME